MAVFNAVGSSEFFTTNSGRLVRLRTITTGESWASRRARIEHTRIVSPDLSTLKPVWCPQAGSAVLFHYCRNRALAPHRFTKSWYTPRPCRTQLPSVEADCITSVGVLGSSLDHRRF